MSVPNCFDLSTKLFFEMGNVVSDQRNISLSLLGLKYMLFPLIMGQMPIMSNSLHADIITLSLYDWPRPGCNSLFCHTCCRNLSSFVQENPHLVFVAMSKAKVHDMHPQLPLKTEHKISIIEFLDIWVEQKYIKCGILSKLKLSLGFTEEFLDKGYHLWKTVLRFIS